MKFTNVFFVTAFLIVSGLPVSGQEKKLQVDNYIKTEIKKKHIPGAAVAVLRNGKVEMMNGYGLANIEQNKPVTLNTEFQIGSTTKPFTAMAIMLLVEDGKIIIDEKASKYLVWLPEIYRDITVRQLLTHTSGVRSDLRTANVDNFSLGDI